MRGRDKVTKSAFAGRNEDEERRAGGGARGVGNEVLDDCVQHADVAECDAQPLEVRLRDGRRRRVEHRERPRGARAARVGGGRALRRVPPRTILRAAAARTRRLGAGALRAAIRVPERQQRWQTQLPAARQLVLAVVARGALTAFETVVLKTIESRRHSEIIRAFAHEQILRLTKHLLE